MSKMEARLEFPTSEEIVQPNDAHCEFPPPKNEPVHTTFGAALKSIMQNNTSEELVEGFEVLSKLLHSLLTIEDRADAFGQERADQKKFRTIFSQNSAVNNYVLSLAGQIEDLIAAIGYEPQELGNPDLKPNYTFRGDTVDEFRHVRKCTQTIDCAISALQKSI